MWLDAKEDWQYRQSRDSLSPSIVMMEAVCFQDQSVSVKLTEKDAALRLVYRVAGKGTEEFSEMQSRRYLLKSWDRLEMDSH